MTSIHFLCIMGCILAAAHAVLSLPVIVKIANSQVPAMSVRNMHLWSGLLMYACWSTYGYIENNYLLAFALVLGILKYVVVLIQLSIGFTR